MRIRILVLAGISAICAVAAIAQTKLEFEVASIRPTAPDARGMFIRPGPGDGVTITNMTLKEMIVLAWRVQPFQISSGPAWIDSVHYDVIAKPAAKPQRTEIPLMLQSLLEDRFQLTLHHETKELPIYALVVARKDGKLGPRLTKSKEGGCTPPDPSKPPPLLQPGERPTLGCGGSMMGPGVVMAVSVPVANLAPGLSRLLGRIVVDKTGLPGNFDINLEWTPDDSPVNQLLPPNAPKPARSNVAGPSLFTALQEQLGLKLESQRGPVDVLVVERAEKPSEN
jgi:uncharacterized protein (TIGR03435 family)